MHIKSVAIAIIMMLLSVAGPVVADDGTWNVDTNGYWSDPANWDGGIIADGADATAYFSVSWGTYLDVDVDTSRTIGHLVIYDNSGGSFHFDPASGGTLTLSAPNSQPSINVGSCHGTYSSIALAGTEGFIKTGRGTLGLWSTDPCVLSGVVDVQEGNLYLLNTDQLDQNIQLVVRDNAYAYTQWSHTIGSLAGAGEMQLFNDSNLDVGSNGLSTEFSGIIMSQSEASWLRKSGSGTLTLSGTNTYGGGTIMRGGTLSVSHNSNLGDTAGELTFDGGILQIAGTTFGSMSRTVNVSDGGGEFNIADPNHTFTFNGRLEGFNEFAKSGPGTLSLTGNNSSYDGTVYAKEGTLGVGINDSLGNSTDVRIDAGALVLVEDDEGWGGFVGDGELDLGGYLIEVGRDNDDMEFDGTISGTGQVTKSGDGTMTLTGDNTFSGVLTVNGGAVALRGNNNAMSGTIHVLSNRTLYAGINDSLSDQTLVTLEAGATLTMEEGDRWGSLSGAGDVDLGSYSSGVGYDNTDTEFGGSITGTGSFTKGGSGTMTLSGSSDWTGGTIIEGGVLLVSHDSALGGGDVALVGGSLVVADGAGTLSVGGDYTQGSGGTLEIELGGTAPGTEHDQLNVTGTATLAGTLDISPLNGLDPRLGETFEILTAGSVTGTFDTVTGASLPCGEELKVTYTATAVLLTAPYVSDGTWIVDASGDWSDPANWDGGIIASGADSTAYFTILPTNDIIITVDAARTIGHIVTGENPDDEFRFRCDTGANYILTLSAPSSQPSITVGLGQGMYSSVTLAGTEGFIKLGPGTLILNSIYSNTLSGVVDVREGNLGVLDEEQLGSDVDLIMEDGTRVDFEYSHTIGSLAGAGEVYLWDSSYLDVGTSGLDTEFAGIIGSEPENSSLRKSGSGTFILSGDNGYDGGTVLNDGTVSVSQESNLGDTAGGLTLNGGILQITGTTFGSTVRTVTLWGGGGEFDIDDPNHTFTFSQGLFGANPLRKSGPGKLSLTGDNTSYTGTFYAKEGTLGVGINGSLGDYTDVRIDAGAVVLMEADEGCGGLIGEGELDLGGHHLGVGLNGYGIEFDGAISGTGQVTKYNGGTMWLNGDNTFSGTLTVNGGTVVLRGNNSAMSGTIYVSSNRTLYAGINNSLGDQTRVELESGATLIMESGEQWGSLGGAGDVDLGSFSNGVGYDDADAEFSGYMTGSGSFTKGGTGVMTLSGTVDRTGETIIEGGVLSISDDSHLGDTSEPLTFAGGQLRVTGTTFGETTRPITISEPFAIDVVDAGGTVGLSTDLAGTVDLTKLGDGVLALRGDNAAGYTGDIYVDAGTLGIGVSDSLGSQSRVTLASGTNLLMEGDEEWGSLAGDGDVDLGSYNIQIGLDDSDATFSGTITGAGSVTKTGAGTLTLSGANDYSGGTTIEGGVLIADDDSALSTGSVVVDAGGALAVADGAGTLTVGDDYTQTASGTLQIELGGAAPGTEYDQA